VSPIAPVEGEAIAATLPPRAQAPHLPRQLSDAEFVMLRSAGPSRRVAAGEVLFRKGELGHNMYIIETGEVRLDFGDGLPTKVLGPREYFGELALFIGNHTRVAGAITHTACSLRVVEYPAFDHLLENEPALLAQFMRRSFAYLVASEQQLIAFLKRRNEDLMQTLWEGGASDKPGGMGIGLSVAREIVHAHNGRISVANRPSGGAMVCIEL